MHRSGRFATTLLGLALAALPVAAEEPVERLTAFAVDLGGRVGSARSGTVDLVIDRWSTDAERDRLFAALREGGSDALLKELQDIDEIGHIQSPGHLGYPLRFAREVRLPDGGRRLILATDRPIGFLEARAQTRSLDYPFAIVDIRLGPDGEGQGKLLPLAKVEAHSKHLVEIENYDIEPVRLTRVRDVSAGEGS
jgi:hypothetical protein